MSGFDLIIRGGSILDGTGRAPYTADIGLAEGRIAAIGTDLSPGRREIDADGLIVTPGFVDIHTHYDGQAVWDARLQPSSWHGVTTAIMGNCGVGFAPVHAGDRQRLIELMEGVEDIPGTALHAGLDWAWTSFGDYLDHLSARQFDLDIGAQLPHGALRVFVMGERGANLDAATEEDCARMRILAREALLAGAIGFSTSRTLNHRTKTGDPTPSLRAGEAELTAIAGGLADAGRGVIELISDFDTPDPRSEWAMITRMVKAFNRPLSFSLAQAHRAPESWRDLLAWTGEARAVGLPIRAQIAPRPIGLLFGLQGSLHPFLLHPSFQAIADLPLAARAQALRDPAIRARLLSEAPATKNLMFVQRITDWANMYPLGDPPNYEPPASSSIAAQALARAVRPEEVALDHLAADDGRSFLYSPFANYARPNLDACGDMIASPHTLLGLGDGGAHVGIISDASFTTYLLTHWGRDRAKGRFDLPYLIKRLTADNADAIGMTDRGRLAVGLKADLNLIDWQALQVLPPIMAYDLPAGGKRLLQGARGYRATIVSGEVTYENGAPTGALPGRLVRSRSS